MTEPVKQVRDYRAWMGIVVLLVTSAVFAVIAATVATKDPILQRDLQVLVWLHTHGSPVFTAFLLAVTQLHSTIGVTVFTVILAIVLARRHKWYWVLALGLAVGGGMVLNVILKLIFHRDRPVWEDPLLTLATNSFPSGHAAGATLFYGFFSVYVVSHVKELSLRAICVVISVLMVALVAFSRMYLGVHYLSDVLGAISMSTAWLVLCLWGVRIYSKKRRAA
jgi:membrane-associated phospholipid phosphatase